MAKLYKRGRVWYSYLKIRSHKVRKALSSDRRIAENKLADLIKQRDAVRHSHAPRDMRWSTFRNEYIGDRKAERAGNTWEGDERAFRELEAAAPIQRLSQVTPGLLEKVRSKWISRRTYKKTKKVKAYVINRDMRSIRTAMRWAERQGYVPKQEWTVVQYIKTPKGRLHFFSVEDLTKLKAVCKGIWLTLLYLGARAGLRPAEMYWLEWSDIDFDRNRVHISPKESWHPKDYECRSIPMPTDLREHLLQARAKRTDSRVLGDKGRVPTLNSMTVYFKRLARKAGLRGTPYTLRHTFGSHYTQNGGNIYRLQEYMGHADIETTMIYVHTAKGKDETIEQMAAF